MDPLADIVSLLRPHAVLAKPVTGRGRWGVRHARSEGPGFAIVNAGRCWLEIEDDRPLLLETGDFVLLPSSPSMVLFSDAGATIEEGWPVNTASHHGDAGAPDTELLGGTFQIERANAPLLVPLLPRLLHVRAAAVDTGRLAVMVELIRDESAADRVGREAVLERLLEVMLVECLRWPAGGEGSLGPGLLSGIRDPALARALKAIHTDVAAPWTLARLAAVAAMSRSVFAARFSRTVGCAPMEYLARWRMTLAKDRLAREDKSLEQLAAEIGYQSASAFSTAFSRRVGCSPSAYARLRRTAAQQQQS